MQRRVTAPLATIMLIVVAVAPWLPVARTAACGDIGGAVNCRAYYEWSSPFNVVAAVFVAYACVVITAWPRRWLWGAGLITVASVIAAAGVRLVHFN